MKSSPLLLLSFLTGFCYVQATSEFRVCAFNLQHFGDSKSKKSNVMHTLTRILSRCDVTLLQEVRDSKEKAVPLLLERLNRYDDQHVYDSVASERLGRSESYQEQYVFVYRTNTVTITGKYQYPDNHPGNVDAFAREPFVVRFRAPKTAIKDFVLIPQHTTPTNTTRELDALYDVLQHVKRMWKTEDVMLLGDFNADCGYLPKKYRKDVRLITEKSLVWLIPDKTDTTVRSSTSCTYDSFQMMSWCFHWYLHPVKTVSRQKYLTATSLLIVLFEITGGHSLTCQPSEYQVGSKCCPMCLPGLVVRSDCTTLSRTECKQCETGTYMNHPNGLKKCLTCSTCEKGHGLSALKMCTTTSDTVCDPLSGYFCTSWADDTGCSFAEKHSQCSAGERIKDPGTNRTDTVCEPCPTGSFSTDGMNCAPWTVCSIEEVRIIEGSATSDVVCTSGGRHRSHYIVSVPFIMLLLTVVLLVIKVRTSEQPSEPRECSQ